MGMVAMHIYLISGQDKLDLAGSGSPGSAWTRPGTSSAQSSCPLSLFSPFPSTVTERRNVPGPNTPGPRPLLAQACIVVPAGSIMIIMITMIMIVGGLAPGDASDSEACLSVSGTRYIGL